MVSNRTDNLNIHLWAKIHIIWALDTKDSSPAIHMVYTRKTVSVRNRYKGSKC